VAINKPSFYFPHHSHLPKKGKIFPTFMHYFFALKGDTELIFMKRSAETGFVSGA